MSLAVRGTGCDKQGVPVEGYYRTYDVKVTYTGRVQVFVPYYEDADDVIYEKVCEMDIPNDIDELMFYDQEYKEV